MENNPSKNIHKINRTLICPPKVGHHNQPIKVQIFMGKHYSLEFKHHIVKLILEEHWGVRESTEYFHIASHSSVAVWLTL
ncbi:hypothetical protein [Aggregatibacter actinomycetemcomitans]|uniref:hypothetical protein n=1 Tax=Aggregatibacter actinomycetemcomitans TaxID=714 RepID=UPI00165292FD|nr:hypothetical protein [Aggregatibacter actinomycetemcomitans]